MPQVLVGAAVAGGFAAGAAYVTGGAVLSSFLSVGGTSLILGGFNYVLNRPRKASDSFSKADFSTQTQFTILDPLAHRRIIYGEAAVGGIVAYKEKQNNFLTHLVVMYAGHECNSIEDTEINGKSWEDTRYKGDSITSALISIEIRSGMFVLYTTGGTIWENFLEDWDTVFELSGSTSNDGIWKRVFTGTAPEIGIDLQGRRFVRVERIDGGTVTPEAQGASMTLQIRYVFVTHHLGTDTQAADANLVSWSDKWTTAHQLKGICYDVISISPHRTPFPNGLESIRAIVQGRNDIYDPRGPSTGYSNNNALCCNHHWTNTQYGYGAVYADTVNETALIAAANSCDEQVTLDAGGTENRYTCNGVFDTSQTIGVTLGKLATSMAGRAYPVGGKLVVKAGVYATPTISFDDSNYVGPISVNTRLDANERFNGIKGVYRDRAHSHGLRNFPAQISSTFETEDGGPEHKNIQLEFTDSPSMAQRIARIELLAARQQITWSADLNLSAYRVQPGDNATFENTRFGWDKVFSIVGSALSVNSNRLVCKTACRETDATIYDWNTGLEQAVDPAPDTNLPDPSVVPTPTNLVVQSGEIDSEGNSILLQLNDGTLVPQIFVTWDAPNNFVGRYDIEWQNSNTFTAKTAESVASSYYISGVREGESYNISVYAVNTFGAKSSPVRIQNHVVVGKTALPPDVSAFTVTTSADRTRVFGWRINTPPLDLAGVKIKYTVGFGGVWEDGIELHEGIITQSPYETVNPAQEENYTFMIKAVDLLGNESENATTVETHLVAIQLGNIFAETDLIKLAWPGTITDSFVHPEFSWLIPDSTVIWSGAGTWDSLGPWNDKPVESYSWESEIQDRGSVISSIPEIQINTDASYTIQERHSTDNVIYTPYTSFSGLINYRYIQYKLTLSTL